MNNQYVLIDGERVERNVAEAFGRMARDFHKKFKLTLHVRSGVRTRARQLELWRAYKNGGTLALHPDNPLALHVESNPTGPRALDIYDSGRDAGVTVNGSVRGNWVRKNAHGYGFNPAGYGFVQVEPWHIEYTGELFAGWENDDMIIRIKGKRGSRRGGLYLVQNGNATFIGARGVSAYPLFSDEKEIAILQSKITNLR